MVSFYTRGKTKHAGSGLRELEWKVMGAQNHRPANQTDRSITVILPVLNGAAHIAESLRSISGQSARDIKVLVLDGGSQDATCRIVSALAAEDDRISLVELPGRSLVERLNIGIAMARTRLIARMDADDVALAHPP